MDDTIITGGQVCKCNNNNKKKKQRKNIVLLGEIDDWKTKNSSDLQVRLERNNKKR